MFLAEREQTALEHMQISYKYKNIIQKTREPTRLRLQALDMLDCQLKLY